MCPFVDLRVFFSHSQCNDDGAPLIPMWRLRVWQILEQQQSAEEWELGMSNVELTAEGNIVNVRSSQLMPVLEDEDELVMMSEEMQATHAIERYQALAVDVGPKGRVVRGQGMRSRCSRGRWVGIET